MDATWLDRWRSHDRRDPPPASGPIDETSGAGSVSERAERHASAGGIAREESE
jgi:hypothetical protein